MYRICRVLGLVFAATTAVHTVAAQQIAQSQTRQKHPNVIFITVDTLRADHVGCYGSSQAHTPNIDALARDGVLFERAVSQVPLTWPSHAVMFTGTYPFQNGVQDFTGHGLPEQFRSVAQAFKQAGYATGAVVSSFVLDRSWGLARGFDYYDDAFDAQSFQTKQIGLVDRKAGESVSHALSWLKRNRSRPVFLWLHLYDPHSPYDPPEPYRSSYRSHPYDGEIAYADQELGRLFTWLRAEGLYNGSVIVLASDHGESLGEHGEAEHGFFIYHSTTHVPLIVKPAGGRRSRPARINSPVETVAIAPTLLGIAAVKDSIDGQFNGKSLLAMTEESGVAAYSETFYPFSSFGWSPLHALETNRYHYIDAPTPELYDLVADPQETNNLAHSHAATVSVMKQKLQELMAHRPFKAAAAGGSSLSTEAQEKLRALGYVAYRSPVSKEALEKGLPDPKDKLVEYNAFLKATDSLRQKDFRTAEPILKGLAEMDSGSYVFPFELGESAIQQQKWDEAVSFMKKALELNPNFDQAMTGLAHAFYATGNVEEAETWLRKAVKENPQNYRAWYELARVMSNADPSAASEAYQKTVSIQPNFSLAQRDFGILQIKRRQYEDALRHFEKAAALGDKDARLYNFMGICYSQTGQLQKAVTSLQRAIQSDSNLAEAHLNLGYAYERQRKTRSANAEYAAACRLEPKFCGKVLK
jgi:arylsulfatase A-like enzyme/Tfp pilus assembly protein PilF